MRDEIIEMREKRVLMDRVGSFRDLKVYQRAYSNSLEIHKLSLNFPKHEQYELAGQLRRATKSVAMNIAEGFGKDGSLAEFKRFLLIAQGSCEEVRVHLDYCRDLGYIDKDVYTKYEDEYVIIAKMLWKMIQNWRKI